MYLKRLPTYRRIGFGLCSESQKRASGGKSFYDGDGYWGPFLNDVSSSKKRVVISGRIIGRTKLSKLVSAFMRIQERGVRIYLVTLSPDSPSLPSHLKDHQKTMVDSLSSSGIHILTKEASAGNYAIIDDSLVWYGSVNLLSGGKQEDTIMRTENQEAAQELLVGDFGKENVLPDEYNIFNEVNG